MISFKFSAWAALAISFAWQALPLQADVKLPAIFGDHMVLQEAAKLPVWGTAAPGETVMVRVGDKTATTKADAQGKWRVDLPPLALGAAPLTLTVTGKNTLTFRDVLVGEVWICSGQSNMELSLSSAHNASTVLPQANDSQLRIFLVAKKVALDPVDDVQGKWEICTPTSVPRFSAVGYFFGHDLRQTLNRPVGLIGTYWGGTPAQAWTSLAGLQKDPSLKHYLDEDAKLRTNLPQAQADFPAKNEAFKTAMADWQKNFGIPYAKTLHDWNDAAKAAAAAGQAPPPRPQLSTPAPRPPGSPEGSQNTSARLFNGMVAPLVPFAIKGVIWYQGESNAGHAAEYRALFGSMITDWRERWGEGDFPFLFVQLASFRAGAVQDWPFLREAQLKTLSLPNTGMATAVDIGKPDNIHPTDKLDVGKRLALAARHIAYGENLVYSGPIYQAMQVKDGAIGVSFTSTGSGLIIGSAPWVAAGFQPLSTAKLVGFTIAGEDRNWVPADAQITNDTVVVSSSLVPKPVAVRYAWANAPEGNLYNRENLPASPFRTDDWVDPVTTGSKVSTPPTK